MTIYLSQSDVFGSSSSFDYYDLLPTDNLSLVGTWSQYDLIDSAQKILSVASPNDIDLDHINSITLALINNGSTPLSADIDWDSLADIFVRLYAQHLIPNGQRSVRMRAARVNYFLRALTAPLSPDLPPNIQCLTLPSRYIWDFIYFKDNFVYVDSQSLNFHPGILFSDQSLNAGLPTQIDLLNPSELSITSCYSNGSYQYSFDSLLLAHIPSNLPIVLQFFFCNNKYYLDRSGNLYSDSSSIPLFAFPVNSVWRARFVDNIIFVSDWSIVGTLFSFSLNTLSYSPIDILPVLLLNDICLCDSTYYLVDKMKGSVFAFDKSFNFVTSRLSFGKGQFNLFDPISIRYHDKLLHVSNWLTTSLVSFPPF